MKQVMTIAILWMLASCQKSNPSNNNNNNNGLPSQPTAQASFDSQSGGVYKGSLTGSSGYFVVNLQTGRPFIIFQWTSPAGSIDSLFTTSLANWASGQAISKAIFTGPDGSFFWFSVGAGGTHPSIDSVHIAGHTSPVYASIGKELSTSQIKVYEGTATAGGGNGCYNAITNAWISNTTGIYTYLGTNGDHGGGTFTVSGSQIQITYSWPGTDSGNLTISSDGKNITGTVTGSGNNSCVHTINLTRIL